MDARDDVRGHEMGRRDGRRRARKAILEERVLPGGLGFDLSAGNAEQCRHNAHYNALSTGFAGAQIGDLLSEVKRTYESEAHTRSKKI